MIHDSFEKCDFELNHESLTESNFRCFSRIIVLSTEVCWAIALLFSTWLIRVTQTPCAVGMTSAQPVMGEARFRVTSPGSPRGDPGVTPPLNSPPEHSGSYSVGDHLAGAGGKINFLLVKINVYFGGYHFGVR